MGMCPCGGSQAWLRGGKGLLRRTYLLLSPLSLTFFIILRIMSFMIMTFHLYLSVF